MLFSGVILWWGLVPQFVSRTNWISMDHFKQYIGFLDEKFLGSTETYMQGSSETTSAALTDTIAKIAKKKSGMLLILSGAWALQRFSFIRSFFYPFSPCRVVGGCWSLSQPPSGERRGRPGWGASSSQGQHRKTNNHFHSYHLGFPIQLSPPEEEGGHANRLPAPPRPPRVSN